jgi:hypothetical protein
MNMAHQTGIFAPSQQPLHTATPWRLVRRSDATTDILGAGDDGLGFATDAHTVGTAGNVPFAMSLPDAEYLVRCANAHDDLIAALQKLQGAGVLHCMCDVNNPCFDNRPTDVLGKHWGGGNACAACYARAALAKAGVA